MCIQMDVDVRVLTAAALLASLMVRVYWPSDLRDIFVCVCVRACACVCVRGSSVSNEIKRTSNVFIMYCKMYIRPCQYSCSLPAILIL